MISRLVFAVTFLSHLGYAFAGDDNGAANNAKKDAINRAKEMLEANLVDPGSVQYRKIYVAKSANEIVGVCFEYNSKNRMGGYVGFKKEYCDLVGGIYSEPQCKRMAYELEYGQNPSDLMEKKLEGMMEISIKYDCEFARTGRTDGG